MDRGRATTGAGSGGLSGSVITLCTPRGRFGVDAGGKAGVEGLIVTWLVLAAALACRRGEDSGDFGDTAHGEAGPLLRPNLPNVMLSLPLLSCMPFSLATFESTTLNFPEPTRQGCGEKSE